MKQIKLKSIAKSLIVWSALMPFLVACNTLPINGSSGTGYSSEEMTIFQQAVGAGALVGGAGGYIVGNRMKKKCEKKGEKNCVQKRNISTGVGAGLGIFVGKIIADNQINNLRNVQLKNNKLQQLLNSARQYNSRTAQYNHRLQADIVKLKRLNAQTNKKNKRATIQLAQKQLNAAKAQKRTIANTIQSRTTIIRALHPKQQGQLKRELITLKKEERKLNQLIAQSEALNKTVRIGA